MLRDGLQDDHRMDLASYTFWLTPRKKHVMEMDALGIRIFQGLGWELQLAEDKGGKNYVGKGNSQVGHER
jgi:hypothetical protein